MSLTLYYASGSCSLAPHIALIESGLPFETARVDLKTHLLSSGQPYQDVAPKNKVPALRVDSGDVLTEGVAIMQYIADRAPQSGLAPAAGTWERYRLLEMLNFITSELHKGFSPLFNTQLTPEVKAIFRGKIGDQFTYLSGQIDGKPFALGDTFTVADCYLYTVLSWCSPYTGLNLADWPVLAAYFARIGQRPSVQQARGEEGLKQVA